MCCLRFERYQRLYETEKNMKNSMKRRGRPKKVVEVVRFCPNCGAPMQYNAKQQRFYCVNPACPIIEIRVFSRRGSEKIIVSSEGVKP